MSYRFFKIIGINYVHTTSTSDTTYDLDSNEELQACRALYEDRSLLLMKGATPNNALCRMLRLRRPWRKSGQVILDSNPKVDSQDAHR